MDENKKKELSKIFDDIVGDNKFISIKELGSGGFGIVKEIKEDKGINDPNKKEGNKVLEKKNDKTYAGKLIEIKNKKEYESDLITEFRGPNILKVIQILHGKKTKGKYAIIVMEKATSLKDLKSFHESLIKNKLKLIFQTPFELIGDNFLRYFLKNILRGLESLDKADFIHFDIKPDNILIFYNLVFKLSDFGLLRNPKIMAIGNDENNLQIPGGTPCYVTPEYYQDIKITKQIAKTQDYFALGATIYYLKYGHKMLNYHEDKDDPLKNADNIINLLERAMDQIKTSKECDKDFIKFLCSLINYKPEDRPNFEEIYRNKWLNKYSEELPEIIENNENNDNKLIIELNKSDFLLKKKEYLEKLAMNENNNNNNNDNGNNNNNDNQKKIENINNINNNKIDINKKNIINNNKKHKFIFQI